MSAACTWPRPGLYGCSSPCSRSPFPMAGASGRPYDAGPMRSHLLPAMSRNTATWPQGSVRGAVRNRTPAAAIRAYAAWAGLAGLAGRLPASISCPFDRRGRDCRIVRRRVSAWTWPPWPWMSRRCRTPVIPAAYLLSGIRRGAIKSTWSLVAIELVRSVRVLDVREAGSRSRPQVLRFTPAGFGEQPEQHHDQCWRQEGDQPGYCEPVAAAGHYAEGDQAGDRPQHACR